MKSFLTGVRFVGLLLLLLAVAVTLIVVGWVSMNAGTLLLFALLVAWICYHESSLWEVTSTLHLIEKRLWALEEHAGLFRLWLHELDDARKLAKMGGGALYEHVQWPTTRQLHQWRHRHWNEWNARHGALLDSGSNRFEDDDQDDDLFDEFDDDPQPFYPPPDRTSADWNAYWESRERWEKAAPVSATPRGRP